MEIRSFLQNNKGNPHTVSLIIIETRLLLLTTSDIKDNLSFISALQDELSYIQKFHVYIIQGIIAYNENRFSDAQNLFTNALLCTKQYRLEDWEMAELHYMLSLAAISEYQHILAIEHIEKALTYFNQKVLATRSIDCLLILGNAQKYTKNIIGAIASFNNAKDIMIENGYVHRAGMIEHNLGACYSLLQNHTRALHHFTQSLSVKVHADEQIATIFAIVKEYKKSGNQTQAKLFINKGLSILNSVSKANQELYRHHFSIYRALLFDGFDIILVFESALAYFQRKKSNYYCFIYCHVLADQLVNKKQFKLATTYYKRAFLYHLDHHQVKYWEELT